MTTKKNTTVTENLNIELFYEHCNESKNSRKSKIITEIITQVFQNVVNLSGRQITERINICVYEESTDFKIHLTKQANVICKIKLMQISMIDLIRTILFRNNGYFTGDIDLLSYITSAVANYYIIDERYIETIKSTKILRRECFISKMHLSYAMRDKDINFEEIFKTLVNIFTSEITVTEPVIPLVEPTTSIIESVKSVDESVKSVDERITTIAKLVMPVVESIKSVAEPATSVTESVESVIQSDDNSEFHDFVDVADEVNDKTRILSLSDTEIDFLDDVSSALVNIEMAEITQAESQDTSTNTSTFENDHQKTLQEFFDAPNIDSYNKMMHIHFSVFMFTQGQHTKIADKIVESVPYFTAKEIKTFWKHIYSLHYENSDKSSKKHTISVKY